MTKLSREDVLKLARLSRLRLTDEEVEKFQSELSAILEYVAHLDAANIDGLDPTYQVTGLTNVTRPDVVIDYGVSQKELLKNVPQTQGDHIKVGRMIT